MSRRLSSIRGPLRTVPGRAVGIVVLATALAVGARGVDSEPATDPSRPRTATAGTEPEWPPAGATQSPHQLVDIVKVLARAGGSPRELKDAARRILAAPRPVYFGVMPTRTSDLMTAPRAIQALDASLGRDGWLNPKIRARLVAAAKADLELFVTGNDVSRTPAIMSALRTLRALGEPPGVAVDPDDIRRQCARGLPDNPMSRIASASLLLTDLGERGCDWTRSVEQVVLTTRRSLPVQGEFDLRAALLTESIVEVAQAAGSAAARSLHVEMRTMVRAVLADTGSLRLPDHVDPTIVRILVDLLPPGEPLVLSRRIEEHLVRSLEIPVRHWRRTA